MWKLVAHWSLNICAWTVCNVYIITYIIVPLKNIATCNSFFFPPPNKSSINNFDVNKSVVTILVSCSFLVSECPAGLKCESTIHSHYRRFTHLRIAHHLAGLWPVEHLDIDHKGITTRLLHKKDSHSWSCSSVDK